jgi:hypothetical protein
MLTRESNDGIRNFLLGAGVVLIVIGSLMLVYIGVYVLDAIVEPESVGLIDLLLKRMSGNERALIIRSDTGSFSLGIEEPINTLLFLVLAVWLLSAFAGIVKTIVTTGTQLVTAAKDWKSTDPANRSA